MAYFIEVPVDWLYIGSRIYIIEPNLRTGVGSDWPFPNTVKGFSKTGFFHQHDNSTPVYHIPFSEIGNTVFETKEEAFAALKKLKEKSNET